VLKSFYEILHPSLICRETDELSLLYEIETENSKKKETEAGKPTNRRNVKKTVRVLEGSHQVDSLPAVYAVMSPAIIVRRRRRKFIMRTYSQALRLGQSPGGRTEYVNC